MEEIIFYISIFWLQEEIMPVWIFQYFEEQCAP
jgi:hypothetical protein